MDDLYSFVYRGVLAEASLDKAGRRKIRDFGKEEENNLAKALSMEMLDGDCIANAQRMSVVYSAIHAFENMVRDIVVSTLAEKHEAEWWNKIPDRIRKKVASRKEEEAKFRWHGARGTTDINYCDFGDLSSIIVANWGDFEELLHSLEWSKGILNTLEKSRNIVMHGGVMDKEDIERVGVNIRDWVRQAG